MPFNQQWSFPVELTLHTRPDGPTVFRYPIREIEKLWGDKLDMSPITLHPGENPLVKQTGKYYDIEMEIDVNGSDASEIVLGTGRQQQGPLPVKDKVLENCGLRACLHRRTAGWKCACCSIARRLRHLATTAWCRSAHACCPMTAGRR